MWAGRSAEHQLRSWMERPGNFRLKAMLAAALPECNYSSEEIGHAMYELAGSPDAKRHHLSQAPRGSQTAPAEVTIRPLSYEDKQHSTGKKSSTGYNEPAAARELAKSDSKVKQKELNQGIDLDKYMGRMLINESTTEKDVLWREQLLDTIIMGAEEAKFARNASFVIETDTKKGDHPVQGDDIFAPEIAEGAGIPFNEQNATTVSWDADKHGLGAYVTENLIDHALIDVIDFNIRHLGRAVENSINRRFHNTVIDNAASGNDVETNAGTSAPFGTDLDALLEARNNVIGGNWPSPDTMLMHDEFQLGITAGNNDQNLLFANRAGNMDALGDGEFPAGLFGLQTAEVVPDGPYSGSNTWGYAADGEFGAVMYPRELAFTYIYRDLETKDFDDPIRDIEGANVRAQFDAALGQSGAFARIKN